MTIFVPDFPPRGLLDDKQDQATFVGSRHRRLHPSRDRLIDMDDCGNGTERDECHESRHAVSTADRDINTVQPSIADNVQFDERVPLTAHNSGEARSFLLAHPFPTLQRLHKKQPPQRKNPPVLRILPHCSSTTLQRSILPTLESGAAPARAGLAADLHPGDIFL